jgi:hypothetical protein
LQDSSDGRWLGGSNKFSPSYGVCQTAEKRG